MSGFRASGTAAHWASDWDSLRVAMFYSDFIGFHTVHDAIS